MEQPASVADQALRLINACAKRHGRWPRFLRLLGHNHVTATLHLNTPDERTARQPSWFVGSRPAEGRAYTWLGDFRQAIGHPLPATSTAAAPHWR